MVEDLSKIIVTAIQDWGDDTKITSDNAFTEMQSSINRSIDKWHLSCEKLLKGNSSHKLYQFKESIKDICKDFIDILKYQTPIRDKYKGASFVRHAYERQLDDSMDKILQTAHDLTDYARLLKQLSDRAGYSKLHEVQMAGSFSTN